MTAPSTTQERVWGVKGGGEARYSLSSIPPASALPELSHEKNQNPADKMRPTTPLTIIGSIYPEDSSNNTSLAAPSNPSDLLLTFSNRLSHQCFSCFISYASILNSLYLSISWYFMVFKRGTEQKKLSPSDHRILKDIQIIGVKKEKMTEHADWTQRDRNSSKRVKQKWLFAESKYIPGQSRTALTHRTRLDVWAGNRGCARRSYLHCLFRIKCRWIKMILGKKKKKTCWKPTFIQK